MCFMTENVPLAVFDASLFEDVFDSPSEEYIE